MGSIYSYSDEEGEKEAKVKISSIIDYLYPIKTLKSYISFGSK